MPQLEDPPLLRRSEAKLRHCESQLQLTPEQSRPADPTNFGKRQRRDAFGRRVPHTPQLIVLPETVIDAPATVRLLQKPHPRDDNKVKRSA